MIRLAVAQHDFPVGDIQGNLEKIIRCADEARRGGARLLLYPELALTGYPPEDLLLRPGFMRASHEALERIAASSMDIDLLVGHPWLEDRKRYNALSWFRGGRLAGRYFKHKLPNYAVFDEARYFSSGQDSMVFDLGGVRIGALVCEDAWEHEPAMIAKAAGAQVLLSSNASPYHVDKLKSREAMFRQRATETGLPMVYCNIIGAQDELVFDGQSALVDAKGAVTALGPLCREALLMVDLDPESRVLFAVDWPAPAETGPAEVYTVLVRGLQDYVWKNGFTEVVLGLSGGVDSALTLALAVDALGAECVHAVMMPSRHTSSLSLELAREQAQRLEVDYRSRSIEASYDAMIGGLMEDFEGLESDVTEQNLQARLRGNIIMAFSNKFGWLPLATGNKSELAVGYSTIYGDMCGGFSPIKDCYKTRVYDLCQYRNSISPAIPQAVIDRAPTAELAPGQTDQDSLPPYDVLDEVLFRFVDQDCSIKEIVAAGFEESMVRRVAGLVLANEYKRRQGAPGTRITSRGFGRDRRYPITSGWRENILS